jgi:hypothetical protein
MIRKQVDEEGCKKLVALSKETDATYIPLLVSTADKYLAPAFYIWQKYEAKLGAQVSLLMNILHSKITYSKLDQFRVVFDRLKDKYQRSTKKRVALLEESQIKLFQTDSKLKSFA